MSANANPSGINTNRHTFDNILLGVKYPGNVINPDKALETLGGIQEISMAAKTKNRRLELRFRPNDAFSKPACGDKHTATSFLLRVRIKKSRIPKNSEKQSKEDDQIGNKTSINLQNQSQYNDHCRDACPPSFDPQKYENLSADYNYSLPKLKVLGRLETEFRFTSLCDFQYLPIVPAKDNPKKSEYIYESIYPVGIPPISWLKEDVPYFLPPAAFSRIDTVQQYVPRNDSINIEQDDVFIGKTRKRRAGLSNFINFQAEFVPTNPPPGIETAMKIKFLQNTHVDKMRELFNQRPIWSKAAIIYHTGYTNEQLKILLPTVAYYFTTGPWRITWVKLGYDPRKDPLSRNYQILDYRLKAMHGLQETIKCKRNSCLYTLPYKTTASSKLRTNLQPMDGKETSNSKTKEVNENVYIYKPGTIPPSRQMFYQYCDLQVSEIEEMLSKYKGPPPGAACHEKMGWFLKGFDDICREIINKQVRLQLRQIMKVSEKHSTGVPKIVQVKTLVNTKIKKCNPNCPGIKPKVHSKISSEPLSENEELGSSSAEEDYHLNNDAPSTSTIVKNGEREN